MAGISFPDDFFDEDNHQGGGDDNNNSNAGGSSSNDKNASKGKKPKCPNCGSTEIESHSASGASICTECGVVVEENAIVSSVEFVEGAGGSHSMVGQFVSGNSSKAYSGGGGRHGFSRDSRETTLANSRRRIQEVASRMRLGHHLVDSAQRFYTIALERNFVQGRKSYHVTATCLYVSCRQEKTQHMLIDFSDALQVNVYTLGICFLKFRRMLGLKLDVVDPALYIYRFAAHLSLNEKANAVSLTALRVVGRMKRDWMVVGRRPAGICAAALLIASRAHGFKMGKEEVTKVMRVCGMTVNNRLREFEQTPSAQLTLEQFTNVDLDHEADPPVYTKNKLLEARTQAIIDNDVELLQSGALDNPYDGKKASKWREERNLSVAKQQLTNALQTIESDLKGKADAETADLPETQTTSRELVKLSDTHVSSSMIEHPRKGNVLVVLPSQATEEELQASTLPRETKFNLNEWKEGLPDKSADEIDMLFRDDDEMEQKEALFDRLNKDYVDRKRHQTDSADGNKDGQTADKSSSTGGTRKYKKRPKPGDDNYFPTTEEALLAAMSTRKVSRKINYDAMSTLFDDQGSFATDLLVDKDVSALNEFDL